jgi:hypothetical protein
MKKTDRELTAWIDGEGPKPSDPSHEAAAVAALSCREQLRSTALSATDPGTRFNAQILSALRIENLHALEKRQPDPVGRLAWGGATLLFAAAIWTLAVVPRDPNALAGRDYYASVTRTVVAGQHVSAVPVGDVANRGLTVVWIDGLDYLPEERTP